MVNYIVDVYTDAGRIMTEPCCTEIPMRIYELVTTNLCTHTYLATDISGLGCRFYILKPGVPTEWSLKIDDDTFIVKYKLDEFDETSMKWLSKIDDTKKSIDYHSTITYYGTPLEIN